VLTLDHLNSVEFGQSVLIVMSEKGSKEVWLTDYRRRKH